MLSPTLAIVHDEGRLAALRATRLLDTPPEESFDRLVRLAARLLGAPVSRLDLVDETRAFAKSMVAPPALDGAREIPVELSLCGHVVAAREPVVIPSTARHPLSRDDHALREAGLLAYAGVPLFTGDGHAIGSLCVLDVVEREWTSEEVTLLREVAESIRTEIDLRRELSMRETVEERLADAQRRFRDLLDAVNDLVVVVGTDGTLRYANRAWRETTGVADDGAAVDVTTTIVADRRDPFLAAVRRVCAGEGREAVETIFRRADGSRVLAAGTIDALVEQGTRVAARAVLRDMTGESREAEAKQRLVATLEAASDVVAILDVHGRVSYLNEAGRRMLDVRGDLAERALHVADLHPGWAYDLLDHEGLPTALAKGEWRGETALRGAGGREIPVSQVVIAHESNRGGVWFLSTIMRDVTAWKRAEEALRESEARFRRLSDASRDGVVVTEDGVIRETNQAFTALFGWSEVEALGREVTALVHPGRAEELASYLARGLDGTMETVGVTRSGQLVDLEVAVTPLTLDGFPARVLVFRDISGFKAVDRLKSEFVTTVSHELRTPLTSIRGSLGLVRGGAAGEVPAKAQDLLQIALDNTDRLTRLVNDVLDLDKIESGTVPLRLGRVEPGELLEAVVTGIGPMALQAGVTIRREVATPLEVVGDRDRVIQVLTNLVSNALKFAPAGSEVIVRATHGAAGIVRFEVEDHGPGIPPQGVARLFTRFSQLDPNAARRGGGSGLGLAISRALVEQHRGRIGVESDPGVRTLFWFELPALAPVARELPARAALPGA